MGRLRLTGEGLFVLCVLRFCHKGIILDSMKTLSVKLPTQLAGWLARRSKELGRTQSDLVREALEQQRTGSGKPSCHDLMQDLCGSFDGPRDLSTNPKYMKDFGR